MPTPSTPAHKTAVTPTNKATVAHKAVAALAPEVGLGFSPGNKTQPQTEALAPAVCLPIPRKTTSTSPSSTRHLKLVLSFALASTLITSCEPPKPVPKTTTHIL
jgi:hypothetical protein